VSSFQVWIAIVGWIFLFYLNNRTLRRSDISRQKDRLVERVDAIRDWYIDEIRLDEAGGNRMSLEQNLSAQITQVEIRIKQLNNYVKCEIVNPEILAKIRGIDNSSSRCLREIIEEVHIECSDLNESIELAYDKFLGEKNLLRRLWFSCRYELMGGILGLGVLMLFIDFVFLFYG